MIIERYADDLVVWAPAKVNLFLEVLAKRADGYHEIATLMLAVGLYDTLVFKGQTSDAIRLTVTQTRPSPGSELPNGPENLVTRAARLLQEHTGCRRGASIRLVKRIPLAAGLAGGSTDAAAALAGLNQLWHLQLKAEDLAQLAAQLGSDVPFFFATPAAWCTGRGERVSRLFVNEAMAHQSFHLVLIRPPFGIATADVYRAVAVPDKPRSGEDIRQALIAGDVDNVGRLLHNRLQAAAERLCPALAGYREHLALFHPAGVLLSGSGSTMFALCRQRAEARRIARQLRNGPKRINADVYLVRSCPMVRAAP
jgi:4-diphosphocytidyl-2-C-methyl-D-erythritol kinase